MPGDDPDQRLSQITTLWTVVLRGHHGPAVPEAQGRLMERYSGAVHRYLRGAVRDPDAADELFQEFCLRFVRGDFRNAVPEKGRFRSLLKTALFHLIVDHQRRLRKRPRPLTSDVSEPAATGSEVYQSDERFLDGWRKQLMDLTWVALARLEQETGVPYHTVLRMRADHPSLSSADLAQQVGARLSKSWSIAAIRQTLHRSREKFTDLLLNEVVQSMAAPSPDRLEEELGELGLLSHCRAALDRWRKKSQARPAG